MRLQFIEISQLSLNIKQKSRPDWVGLILILA